MTINRTFYISKKKVSLAGDFISEYGRDIDKVLFAHHFADAPASAVVSVLEGYLNEDGGAGGLEPDMLYKGSTPVSCAMFLEILTDLKISAEFEAVSHMLSYLADVVPGKKSWNCVSPEVMSAPRASWWNWDEEKAREYSFNPTCEILGYFYQFGGGDYRSYAKEGLDILQKELMQRFAGTLEMHDVVSLMQLCRVLPDVMAERFIAILKPHLNEMIITDKSQWNGYVMSPLTVFKSPLDPLYYDFEKAIDMNLDYEIAQQSDDGIWEPEWHWGQFEEEFAAKKNEICSYVTINKLIKLKNFSRINRMG